MPTIRRQAKKLLTEAGFADGFSTELYAMNVDPNPRIAQAIQQDLAAVGIKAEIKSLAQAEVITAGGAGQGVPMIWSGGMAWIADFPDPVELLLRHPRLRRRGRGRLELVEVLQRMRSTSAPTGRRHGRPAEQASARAEAWKGIFNDVLKDAPWAPIFNEKRFTLHSPRLGGDAALFTDPIHIPVNYDYIFAKDAQ